MSIWAPGQQSHGNSSVGRPFIRTLPEVMEAMKESLSSGNKPKAVYNKHISGEDLAAGPRNLKQVQNLKYATTKQAEQTSYNNFADHIQQVLAQFHVGDSCIQQVSFLRDRSPVIILYNYKQLKDISRFCCSHPLGEVTVLGLDKTYNLGSVFVTCTNFKHLGVRRCDTGEHPITIGPAMLHGSSDEETFQVFFSHLSHKLRKVSSPIIGSDDELAVRNAVAHTFPESSLLLCTRHLKENLCRYMADKIGVPAEVRQQVKAQVFLCNLDSQEEVDRLKARVKKISPQLENYLSERVLTALQGNKQTEARYPFLKSREWTNNNAESVNHIFKQAIDWKPQPLPKLISTIEETVLAQQKNFEKSLISMGDFALDASFAKLQRSQASWATLTSKGKNALINKFYKTIKPASSKFKLASDNAFAAFHSRHGGKNPTKKKENGGTGQPHMETRKEDLKHIKGMFSVLYLFMVYVVC
ncbi:hypothetical protein BaRGS_00003282 [Batillaria attramentaria]|uniref:MULE transposase domain-containing protein n=1 Tax=Batillaria attramentaria TaxID=370345 RepID=A0ABD0M1Q6_9CAEN